MAPCSTKRASALASFPRRAVRKVPQHFPDHPHHRQQRGNPALSRILNIDVVQMPVPAFGQRPRDIGGNVLVKLLPDLSSLPDPVPSRGCARIICQPVRRVMLRCMFESIWPCGCMMEVTRSFNAAGATRKTITATTGAAATSHLCQNHSRYSKPIGKPSRKMLRVNPSTKKCPARRRKTIPSPSSAARSKKKDKRPAETAARSSLRRRKSSSGS